MKKKIRNLNEDIIKMDSDLHIEESIEELMERNEYICTLNGCPVNACRIVDFEKYF